ncbi:hypothetical protein CJ232_03260 [Hoylesella timonensis]|uniref:Uncharacterized protein n=1 Tax=Hoylesella timonensis TaxID=386414 RepID=A0A2N6Q7D7_9BACT|nr:hypothetical protein CJ232_03260 [Hoylesella timonensis]
MGEWLCSREMKKAAHQVLLLSIVTHKKKFDNLVVSNSSMKIKSSLLLINASIKIWMVQFFFLFLFLNIW